MNSRPAVLAILLASLAAAGAGAPAWGQSGEAQAGREVRTVDLTGPDNVHYTLESSTYEVVVRFDQPIAEAEIARFAKAAGGDLADLRWNDASIVLRAAADRRLVASVSGATVRVSIFAETGEQVAQAPEPTTQQDIDTELEIARAQADAAAGYPGRARKRLAKLADARPDDLRLQRLLGDAEAADGALGPAGQRYRAAKAEDRAARRIAREAGGTLGAGVTIRDGKTFSLIEYAGAASIAVNPRFAVGAGIHRYSSRADSVAGPAGVLTNIKTNTTIGDLTASARMGKWVRLDLLAAMNFDANIGGAGAQLSAGPAERRVRLTGAYRLPDLSTQEQATFGGHLSRIGVGGNLRLSPSLAVQADVYRNAYGLKGGGARSKSVSVVAGIDALMRRRSPSLTLGYRFDSEYVDATQLRPNGFAYISLADRENHTAQAISNFALGNVNFTGAAGWTVDRYSGADGPSANLSASAYMGDAWRAEASGGVSSVSRPGFPDRQFYFRFYLTRFLGS